MIAARQRSRTGVVLICVLACLLVALSLVMSTVHLSLRSRRQCRWALQCRQTELLVDAGFSRAVQQLRQSKEYHGEAWQPQRLPGLRSALVEITLDPDASNTEASDRKDAPAEQSLAQVTVTAQTESFSHGTTVQRTQVFTVQLHSLSSVE